MLPYTKSLKERFKNIYGKMVYKSISEKVIPSEASYWPLRTRTASHRKVKCDRLECDEEYIGDSATLGMWARSSEPLVMLKGLFELEIWGA